MRITFVFYIDLLCKNLSIKYIRARLLLSTDTVYITLHYIKLNVFRYKILVESNPHLLDSLKFYFNESNDNLW